jgi:hypothetical protein
MRSGYWLAKRCPLALLGLDSSDSAHCPSSFPVTTNTPEDTKGTAMFDEQCLLGLCSSDFVAPPSTLPSDDSALIAVTLLLPPSTQPIVATMPLLLTPTTLHSIDSADCSDSAFAAKKYICSKRWSHCPETIVSKGTGTLSVAKAMSCQRRALTT